MVRHRRHPHLQARRKGFDETSTSQSITPRRLPRWSRREVPQVIQASCTRARHVTPNQQRSSHDLPVPIGGKPRL